MIEFMTKIKLQTRN